jgi:hypothetical protein
VANREHQQDLHTMETILGTVAAKMAGMAKAVAEAAKTRAVAGVTRVRAVTAPEWLRAGKPGPEGRYNAILLLCIMALVIIMLVSLILGFICPS